MYNCASFIKAFIYVIIRIDSVEQFDETKNKNSIEREAIQWTVSFFTNRFNYPFW